MELIRKSDALHAVLHNQGDAAVAAVQNIKPINPHGELREMLIDEIIDKGEWQDEQDKALQAWVNTWDNAKGKLIDRICENCDTVCGDCPIVQPIREVFNEQ